MLSDMDAALPMPPSQSASSFPAGLSVANIDPLMQSEARFRALALASGQIYWVADAQGNPVDVTAWCAFTGLPPEEVKGNGWAAAVHPDDRERVLADWATAIATRQPARCEHRLRRADGQYRTVLMQAYPALAADGTVIEWVGVNTDITLLQELRADAQASQEDFRATFEQAAVGIAHVCLGDGRLLRINQKFCEILGYAPEELRSHSFQELTYPPDLDTNLEMLDRLLAGEISTYTLEKRYIRKDGSLVWVNLTASLKRNRSGMPEYGIAVIEDISARKAAEEALRQSEQQWETIFSSMHDGLLVFGPDQQVQRVNPAFRALVGWPADSELYTMSWQERTRALQIRSSQGEPLPPERLPLTQVFQGKRTAEEHIIKNYEGRDVHVSMRAAPLIDAAGHIEGAVIVLQDITERQRLEQQTREALQALLCMAELLVQPPSQMEEQQPLLVGQRLAELACSLLRCSAATIITLDPAAPGMQVLATVGYTSAQEEHLHAMISAWSEKVPDPSHMSRLMAGESLMLDVTRPPYQEYAARFEVSQVVVAPMRLRGYLIGVVVFHPNKQEQTFTQQQIALAGATAQLVGLVIERERLLREREEARARALALHEANRQMDTFLSMASHELRTPLASMKLSIQLLQRRLERACSQPQAADGNLPPILAALQELLAPAERQAIRLERLIKDLLDASRIKEGKLELRLRRADLNTIAREVVAEQRALAPGRAIRLQTATDQALWVQVDDDLIRQAMTNYLANALKYSPETAPVLVGLEQTTSQARVWVRDQGPGIAPADQARIWERFQRVSGIQEQSGAVGGLGLGLYVTKMLIERHQGQVGMSSAPGEGTTFWFTLPLDG